MSEKFKGCKHLAVIMTSLISAEPSCTQQQNRLLMVGLKEDKCACLIFCFFFSLILSNLANCSLFSRVQSKEVFTCVISVLLH